MYVFPLNYLCFTMVLLGLVKSASVQCPNGKITCPEGKLCCLVDDQYECCDNQIGIEPSHTSLMPGNFINDSISVQNLLNSCNFLTCDGFCCSTTTCCPNNAICCRHRGCCKQWQTCCEEGCCSIGTQCCGEFCCPLGAKCCSGQWCCKSSLRCGYHGGCFGSGMTYTPNAITMLLMCIVPVMIKFYFITSTMW